MEAPYRSEDLRPGQKLWCCLAENCKQRFDRTAPQNRVWLTPSGVAKSHRNCRPRVAHFVLAEEVSDKGGRCFYHKKKWYISGAAGLKPRRSRRIPSEETAPLAANSDAAALLSHPTQRDPCSARQGGEAPSTSSGGTSDTCHNSPACQSAPEVPSNHYHSRAELCLLPPPSGPVTTGFAAAHQASAALDAWAPPGSLPQPGFPVSNCYPASAPVSPTLTNNSPPRGQSLPHTANVPQTMSALPPVSCNFAAATAAAALPPVCRWSEAAEQLQPASPAPAELIPLSSGESTSANLLLAGAWDTALALQPEVVDTLGTSQGFAAQTPRNLQHMSSWAALVKTTVKSGSWTPPQPSLSSLMHRPSLPALHEIEPHLDAAAPTATIPPSQRRSADFSGVVANVDREAAAGQLPAAAAAAENALMDAPWAVPASSAPCSPQVDMQWQQQYTPSAPPLSPQQSWGQDQGAGQGGFGSIRRHSYHSGMGTYAAGAALRPARHGAASPALSGTNTRFGTSLMDVFGQRYPGATVSPTPQYPQLMPIAAP